MEVVCLCNKPAIRQITKKEGPNKGRAFFTCKTSACGFFCFESDLKTFIEPDKVMAKKLKRNFEELSNSDVINDYKSLRALLEVVENRLGNLEATVASVLAAPSEDYTGETQPLEDEFEDIPENQSAKRIKLEKPDEKKKPLTTTQTDVVNGYKQTK